MRISIFVVLVFIAIPFLVSANQPVIMNIESMQIIQIMSQEEKAIVTTPDSKRHILKVGDSIGKNGKVIEILEGRIVFEEKTDKGIETVIIRIEDGKQKIERIRKMGDKRPGLYSPIHEGHEGTRK